MRRYFSGFAGKKLEEFACAAGIKHLAIEAHKPGSHRWFTDGKAPADAAGNHTRQRSGAGGLTASQPSQAKGSRLKG